MTPTKPLSFGIKTSQMHTTHEEIIKVWQEADTLPEIDHAWLFDHFIPIGGEPDGPCLEGWTLLSAYAVLTKRLRIGLMVSGNTYRHPAVLAKMASTIDILSNGRLDLGLGAGWNEREHESYGIELYRPGERLRIFEEACEVIKRMWTEKAPNFEGRYYQLKEAYCEPKPIQKPYPPFVIGGGGEKVTLRIAAKYADIWNIPGGSVEEFKHKSAILDQHCADVGRNSNDITRSIQYIINPNNLTETRDALRPYIEAGVTHIILNIRPPFPEQISHQLVEEVITPLKHHYQ